MFHGLSLRPISQMAWEATDLEDFVFLEAEGIFKRAKEKVSGGGWKQRENEPANHVCSWLNNQQSTICSDM